MIIITVQTVTIGLKAKKALANSGIKSKVIKIDGDGSEKGCKYGLEFREGDFYDAISILRSKGIEYGVYKSK